MNGAGIRVLHPTPDGEVHISVDGEHFVMTWMDAIFMGHALLAYAGVAAHIVGATEPTIERVASKSWDSSRDDARAAFEALTHD